LLANAGQIIRLRQHTFVSQGALEYLQQPDGHHENHQTGEAIPETDDLPGIGFAGSPIGEQDRNNTDERNHVASFAGYVPGCNSDGDEI
jgi:hypothetical protein